MPHIKNDCLLPESVDLTRNPNPNAEPLEPNLICGQIFGDSGKGDQQDSDLKPEPLGLMQSESEKNGDGTWDLGTFPAQSIYQVQDDELIKAWLYGKSEITKLAYKRISRELRDHLHPKSLRDADITFLQTFIDFQKTRKPETLKLRTSVVRSLFSFAIKAEKLEKNPAQLLNCVSSQENLAKRYLTEDEVMRMIHLTTKIRDIAILKVLYGGGLRVAELCDLKWADVTPRDVGGAQLQVKGKGSKFRSVNISEGIYLELIKLRLTLSMDSHYIFTSQKRGRISDDQVRAIITQARLKAGITKKVSCHWMRHAHASHALDRGAPIHLVQATLGHASVASTGKYLHARPQESSGKFLGV